jgi:hypothetical protein
MGFVGLRLGWLETRFERHTAMADGKDRHIDRNVYESHINTK